MARPFALAFLEIEYSATNIPNEIKFSLFDGPIKSILFLATWYKNNWHLQIQHTEYATKWELANKQ